MMKTLKKLLFATVLVIGCSLVAFGQQDDGKKQDPPPKRDIPTIDPKPKPTPKPTPKPKPNLTPLSNEATIRVIE